MADNLKNTLIGKGWSFPMQLDPQGRIALVTNSSEIEQSMRIILETLPGERRMRPTFGCRAKELLFEPINGETQTRMVEYVEQALDMWEPRINVIAVEAEPQPGYLGHWDVAIRYEVKSTHDERSIVHPFFIEDEEPVI